MSHILCADLSSWNETLYDRLYRAASHQRQARADRMSARENALACVAADALLRRALLEAFGTGDGFSLGTGPRGKPYIENQPDFHFSLSHSGPWIAIAWGKTPVGLDVQVVNRNRPLDALARKCLTQQELAHYQASEDRADCFFTFWTEKESYLKYLGTGIDRPLNTVSPEEGLCLHHRDLENAKLCLCCRQQDITMEIMPGSRLLEEK